MMLLPVPPIMMAIAAPVPDAAAHAAILAAMADSAAGWNAGDLDRFMAVYADEAVYVTGKGLVRGRSAIADTYRKSFAAGGNTRGRLSFVQPAFRSVGPAHMVLWARWVLAPAGETKGESGMTTLLFERRREGWRIVSDHSS